MVSPSQFLDPDVFLVVNTEHLLDSYLHPQPPPPSSSSWTGTDFLFVQIKDF